MKELNSTSEQVLDQIAARSIADTPFLPRSFLRSGGVQTLLSRLKPVATDRFHVDQPLLVDAGPDLCDRAVTENRQRRVQLLGYYTPHLPTLRQGEAGEPALAGATHLHDNRRGLVMILHGWEGCSHSNYNLLLTAALTRAGFDVVRLNLRDHGPNLHLNKYALNPGIFLGILIEEAVHATQLIARMAGDAPFYMVGASMGGNFVLRMALRHAIDPIPNLQKVIAINPAIDPARATDNVDRNPLLRRYFRRRWLGSLLAKQELYPDLYEFAELRSCPTIRQMTEQIIRQYGDRFGNFRNADEYFSAYAVAPEDLADLTVATEIITAVDDPIIDAAAFDLLPANPLLSLQLHPTGGHVGYVDLFPVEHHLPRMVLRALLPLGADEHFGKVSTM